MIVLVGRWVAKLGRWVALVSRLHATAALWVRIKTSLKNTKWAVQAKEWPTHSSPPKNSNVYGMYVSNYWYWSGSKNYLKRSSLLAITLPVQCHENKSVDGDGSSHVDQVLNNAANKLFFIIIMNDCLKKKVIKWELPFKKEKNHDLTSWNDLCAESRIPSCDFLDLHFIRANGYEKIERDRVTRFLSA
jgi:hypothetical protein